MNMGAVVATTKHSARIGGSPRLSEHGGLAELGLSTRIVGRW